MPYRVVAHWTSLAIVLLGMAGCSSNNQGKIEGTKWNSVSTMSQGNMVPAGALSLDFGRDGSLVFKAGPQTFTGKYTLGFGNTLILNLDQMLSGRKTHHEQVTISGTMLTMKDSDGTELSFSLAP